MNPPHDRKRLREARLAYRKAKRTWDASERAARIRIGEGERKPETAAMMQAARAEKWRTLDQARIALAELQTGANETERPLPEPGQTETRPGTTKMRYNVKALAALGVAVLLFVLGVVVTHRGSDTSSLDNHTRAYVAAMKSCMTATGVVLVDIQQGVSGVGLADETTTARNVCNQTRTQLLSLNTNDFDSQAADGFHGIDRYKSGLNALLAYLDTNAPSKLIEARNKIEQGDQAASRAIDEINARRRDSGLEAIEL
jgi:hypothetical protein